VRLLPVTVSSATDFRASDNLRGKVNKLTALRQTEAAGSALDVGGTRSELFGLVQPHIVDDSLLVSYAN
jgi:hypothetical protein